MITAHVEGTHIVLEKIRRRAKKVRSAVEKSLVDIHQRLVRHIQRNKLSGQVLKVQTGRLRRSIHTGYGNLKEVVRIGETYTTTVGTNVWYGKLHEYGYVGNITAPASTRTTSKGTVFVNAHVKRVNLPQRSFIRSALADFEGEVGLNIRESVIGAIR